MHLLRHVNERLEVEIVITMSLGDAARLRKVMYEAAALGRFSQHHTADSLRESLDFLLDLKAEKMAELPFEIREIEGA